MVDRYYRKIEDVENDIKNAMQIFSILLKLKGYDNDLSKIDDNSNNISSNLGKTNNNTNHITNNLKKLDNVTNFISKSEKYFEMKYPIKKQVFKFNKENNFFTIFEQEIEYDFIKNTLLFVQNNIYYKYEDLSDDHHRAQHEYNIYDNENNLIHKYLFNKDTYYDESLDPILFTNEDFCICFKKNYKKIKIYLLLHRHNRHGYGSFILEINENNDNYINLACTDDQNAVSISTNTGLIETNTSSISDNSNSISTNTSSISNNSTLIDTNTSSISSNKGLIETNTSSISDNSNSISINTSSISSNKGLIDTNTSNIADNLGKIETNTSNIADNLGKINDNKNDIIALQTSNVKAFYNLDQIFIYDINPDPNYQTVNKDNHFHIFEKEITYNFTKNSYLEIALKVLNEISHYMLIGYFQILCNFYDQDNNLFYTISLSTAMGSINKLSTIKSVFIVPINENMSKIKIDFFIAPKETQQNRSATFTIKDINSNKIYIKCFQKTDEMSIKDIQDSLDAVKDISNDLKQIDKNKNDIAKINNITKTIMLKNIYFTDFDSKINDTIVRELIRFEVGVDSERFTDLHKAFMKYYFKKDDILEIDCKLLISHTTYEYADKISLFYGLYQGTEVNNVKLLFKEIRRYNQFPLVNSKNRIVAYTKLCYKVEYDMDDILFFIQIGAPNLKKMNLILSHIILEGGFKYISIKHYGKL